MSDEYAIRVCKWEKWQSYRSDRGQPPWIKLHRCLMRNPEWVSLTDAGKAHLISIWLLAADNNGVIATPTWRHTGVNGAATLIRKLCFLENDPDLELLSKLGFIEYDANVTPERRQADANVTHQIRLEESREETDKRREDHLLGAVGTATEPDASDIVYLEYLTVGKPGMWELKKSRLDEYWHIYGKSINVLEECKRARLWLIDNPTKRKTAKGMPRFLTSWLNRVVDRGHSSPLSKNQAKAEAEQMRRAQQAKKRDNGELVPVCDVVNNLLGGMKNDS